MTATGRPERLRHGAASNELRSAVRDIAPPIAGTTIATHQFGADYDRTLMCWHENVQRAWSTLSRRFDERFRRLWSFYLLSGAGAFRARSSQLWQSLLSPRGIVGGWRTVS